jgi:protein-tyrosine kinase
MLGIGSRSVARAAAARKRFEDDIEMLRLRITATAQTGGRVISLVGQRPGAGTTTLALWLARSLARESRRTLLIDGNFANPALHGLLSADPEPGFVDLLEGRAALDDVIRPTSDVNLSLMPCGRCEASVIGAPVGQWRSQWRNLASERFLVIDAGSADAPSALAMADASDGVIVVVKCGDARREQIESLQKRMSLSGARLLGVVLNQRRYVVPDVIYRRL